MKFPEKKVMLTNPVSVTVTLLQQVKVALCFV